MIRTTKLRATPITEETFIRQGWKRNSVDDYQSIDDLYENPEDVESGETDDDTPFFFSIKLPKTSIGKYIPMLISNASDEIEELKAMGLQSGEYFVEMLDTDGLWFCATEEELEILYKALTGKYIEE